MEGHTFTCPSLPRVGGESHADTCLHRPAGRLFGPALNRQKQKLYTSKALTDIMSFKMDNEVNAMSVRGH
jgi:hypothetical protein